MPVVKSCLTCNKEFKVPPCRKSQKYCCVKCNNTNGANNSNWKGGLIKTKCKQCNKKFELKKKDVLIDGNFCSLRCSGLFNSAIKSIKHKKLRIKKKCLICSKELFIKPSHAHKEGKYCSRKCVGEAFKTLLKGEKNPNWLHGKAHINNYYNIKRKKANGTYPKEYPLQLFKMQKGLCVVCKCKLNKYHVDHIMPIALGGSNYPHNIQLLCAKCNHQKHAKHPIDFMQEKGYLL